MALRIVLDEKGIHSTLYWIKQLRIFTYGEDGPVRTAMFVTIPPFIIYIEFHNL